MILILGGSGSGKSEYAEQWMQKAKAGEKYYIATMKVFGEEGRERVKKHRAQREGKGFLTIEQTENVEESLSKINTPKEAWALLECLSNLLANEMFTENGIEDSKKIFEKILNGILKMDQELSGLVIVSNNIFEDSCHYEEGSLEYRRILGRLNEALAKEASWVVEVVAGIPILCKEEKK